MNPWLGIPALVQCVGDMVVACALITTSTFFMSEKPWTVMQCVFANIVMHVLWLLASLP